MGGRPEGGADRCGAMHYATTSGIGSRIFCPAEKAMWEALRRTIECSSKPFCTDIEPAFLGVISLSALVIGRPSISASIDGRRAGVFERIFKLLASDHDNEYMMIDATIVRAHQHSAGARKKRRASDRPIAWRTDHQNSRPRRCLGQSRRVDAHAGPSP